MLWQEVHPGIKPHKTFEAFQLDMFSRIDPNFLRFLGAGRARADSLRIRLEEIVWGGVRVDGIPSLDSPKLITARQADYLGGDDPVFGVSINGDVRVRATTNPAPTRRYARRRFRARCCVSARCRSRARRRVAVSIN